MCEESQGPFAHSAQCMYRSALFYGYMACRGMIDGDPHSEAQSTADRIKQIMKQNWIDGLTPDPPEQRFIDAPFGTLHQINRSEASWLVERMAVLAWALGLADLPDYHTKVNPSVVSRSLGMFGGDHAERIAKATIRDANEILAKGQLYLTVAWRLSEFRKDKMPMDLQTKLTAKDGLHLIVDGISFVDRDIAVDQRPLTDLSDAEFDQTAAIAYYRCKEFRWLFGYECGESTVSVVN